MIDPYVVLAGDWHGNDLWASAAIRAVGDADLRWVFQLGDFGVRAGDVGQAYLDTLQAACADADVWLAVTLGNHENYDVVDGLTYTDRGETAGIALGTVAWVRDRIAILPRVHRFTLTTWTGVTRSVVSLGGAPSIDYPHRIHGASWWPQERVTEADVDAVVAGGPADVMLAHDSPDGGCEKVQRIIASPGGWSGAGLAYARQGRDMMNAAFAAVTPALYAHGHYHVADETLGEHRGVPGTDSDGVCRFVCLHTDGMGGNLARLNLDDLTLTWPTGHRVLL